MKLISVNFVHQISGKKLPAPKFLEMSILVKLGQLDMVEVIDNLNTMVVEAVVVVADVE